ncbi:flagellar hook-length control protein [mine drainage metagenome]|uniref:Flagellar hook-length control protein n=1 Tax=mine drainage metagenome TaxID=410659 RepID=A0A1J5RDA9_9ZZZZ
MPEMNVAPCPPSPSTPVSSGGQGATAAPDSTGEPFATELHRQLSAGQSGTTTATAPAANAAATSAKKTAAEDSIAVADPETLGLAVLMTTPLPAVATAPAGKKTVAATADAGLLAGALPMPLALAMTATQREDTAAVKSPVTASAQTAIPAALATADGSLPAVHAKQADAAVPESAFRNLLATAQVTAQNHGSSPVAPLTIQAPFGSSGWESNVGDKLVWMTGHQEQRAELVLNPPHLGRVEVSLSLHGDQASAQFVSHNPLVRDALEAAIPRLREMLADAGVSLGQAQVGSGAAGNAGGQSPNHQGNGDNSSRSQAVLGQGGSALRQINASSPWLKQGNSLVDVFA